MKLIVVPIKPLEHHIYSRVIIKDICNDSRPIIHISNTYQCKEKKQCDIGIIKVSIKPENIVAVKLMSVPNSIVLPNIDYNNLKNIPSLNGVKIIGEKKSIDFGIENIEPLSNTDIESLLR